jgi:hypothetical protein
MSPPPDSDDVIFLLADLERFASSLRLVVREERPVGVDPIEMKQQRWSEIVSILAELSRASGVGRDVLIEILSLRRALEELPLGRQSKYLVKKKKNGTPPDPKETWLMRGGAVIGMAYIEESRKKPDAAEHVSNKFKGLNLLCGIRRVKDIPGGVPANLKSSLESWRDLFAKNEIPYQEMLPDFEEQMDQCRTQCAVLSPDERYAEGMSRLKHVELSAKQLLG